MLVVPRQEVDHWIDAAPDLLAHMFDVARRVATAIDATWHPKKVGLLIAGLEVPHLHIHLTPIWDVHDFDFDKQDTRTNPNDLDEAASRLRRTLQEQGGRVPE